MKHLLLSSFSLFFLAACSSDNNEQPVIAQQPQLEKGTEAYLRDYIGENAYNSLVAQGVNIHFGQHPPMVDGSYKVTGTVISKTNIASDAVGTATGEAYLLFENQDNATLNLQYENKHHFSVNPSHTESNMDSGYPVISGEDDYFTVVSKVDALIGIDDDARTIHVISGRMTATGIKDFQMFVYMSNNFDHTTYYFANGKSRVYTDNDGTVEIWN